MKDDVVLVDTHTIPKTDEGHLSCIPRHALDEFNLGMAILVEAMLEEIVAKRARDVARVREAEILRAKEEIEFSKYYASSVATYLELL